MKNWRGRLYSFATLKCVKAGQGIHMDHERNTGEENYGYVVFKLNIYGSPVPEFIDPVFTKQAQNARFHLIENERFGWFSRKQGL